MSSLPYNYAGLVPVPVIASFDDLGHIRPLYIRIDLEALKIKTAWLKQSYIGHSVYECQVIVGNFLKPLTLTYYHDNGLWMIPEQMLSPY